MAYADPQNFDVVAPKAPRARIGAVLILAAAVGLFAVNALQAESPGTCHFAEAIAPTHLASLVEGAAFLARLG